MRFPILTLICGTHLALACSENNCLRALIASAFPSRTASADCSSYLRTTITPATSTYTATIYNTVPDVIITETTTTETVGQPTTLVVSDTTTIEVIEVSTISTFAPAKRQVTVTASDIPTYASACSGAVKYASACSCIGVSAVTITAAAPSITITQSLTSTSTTTSVVSLTSITTSFSTITTTSEDTITVSTTTTTTVILPPAVTPVGEPFFLQVANSDTIYDGYDLYYNGCPGGSDGQPYLYVSNANTAMVFGSDGLLHVAACLNIVAGVFLGNSPAVLFLVDPTAPGTAGFVGASCHIIANHFLCEGANSETTFYFPDESFGVSPELYFGDSNYGTEVVLLVVY
ncbi:hypothetical protein N431DRAFT_467909 [Stipitochalara longipes BDJ]|nr:hypothetical protein N431DRAFT_467909 [Stipitochalara longipes BDJ]